MQAVFDDVRMWNRALSDKEIAAIFKNPDTLPSQDGLVYQSNFDEPPAVTQPVWKDAEISLRFKAGGLEKSAERKISGDWTYPRSENLTLNCNLPGSPKPDEGVSIQVSASDNQTVPTAFEPRYDCIVAKANYSFKVPSVSILKRAPSRSGPANYDEFLVEVENQGTQPRNVPFLLEMFGTASITGLVPMLCELDGTPTGIPVQLSKNWHHTILPNYLRAYTLLPSAPGKTSYLLRVVYGFYGSLPSASNSQLSLVGWGDTTNGRWDQLAIGSSGKRSASTPNSRQATAPSPMFAPSSLDKARMEKNGSGPMPDGVAIGSRSMVPRGQNSCSPARKPRISHTVPACRRRFTKAATGQTARSNSRPRFPHLAPTTMRRPSFACATTSARNSPLRTRGSSDSGRAKFLPQNRHGKPRRIDSGA